MYITSHFQIVLQKQKIYSNIIYKLVAINRNIKIISDKRIKILPQEIRQNIFDLRQYFTLKSQLIKIIAKYLQDNNILDFENFVLLQNPSDYELLYSSEYHNELFNISQDNKKLHDNNKKIILLLENVKLLQIFNIIKNIRYAKDETESLKLMYDFVLDLNLYKTIDSREAVSSIIDNELEDTINNTLEKVKLVNPISFECKDNSNIEHNIQSMRKFLEINQRLFGIHNKLQDILALRKNLALRKKNTLNSYVQNEFTLLSLKLAYIMEMILKNKDMNIFLLTNLYTNYKRITEVIINTNNNMKSIPFYYYCSLASNIINEYL